MLWGIQGGGFGPLVDDPGWPLEFNLVDVVKYSNELAWPVRLPAAGTLTRDDTLRLFS